MHTDARADAAAKAAGANAFTVRNAIVFRQGRYAPDTTQGRKLLAHEFTHVLQQRGTGATPLPGISNPSDPAEREADHVASNLDSSSTPVIEGPPARAVQREAPPDAVSPTPPASALPASASGKPALDPNKMPVNGERVTLPTGEIVSSDPDQLRAQLRAQIQKHGIDGPNNFVLGIALLADGIGQATPEGTNVNGTLLAKILPIIGPIAEEVTKESNAYLDLFDQQARANTGTFLENSSKQVETEATRYHLTSEQDAGSQDPEAMGTGTTHSIQGNSPVVTEMRKNAQLLLERRRAMQAKREEVGSHVHVRWYLGLLVFLLSDGVTTYVDDGFEASRKEFEAMGREYEGFRQSVVGRFPVLSGVSHLEDPEWQLEALAEEGNQFSAAQRIGELISARREDIKKTQDGLGDLNLWKLEKVVGITRAQLGVTEGSWQAKLIADKVDENKPGVLTEILIAALNVLALILAPLTEGLSLLAIPLINAVPAGEAVSDYLLAERLRGTAFDPANALAAEDPSLFWLAVQIVGVFVDVAAAAGPAAKAFNSLKGFARAAVSAKEGVEAEEALRALKAAASQEENGAELAGRLESAVEEARGGAAPVGSGLPGATSEEARELAKVAEATQAEARSVLGEASSGAGQVKVTKNGWLFSCSSPCMMVREKYAEALASSGSVAKGYPERLATLEAAAKAATTPEEAQRVAEQMATLEAELRKIPVRGWKSPIYDMPEYADLLERRGTAAETLDRKLSGWTGADEAVFTGLPKAEDGYLWRLGPDAKLSYVRKDATLPLRRLNAEKNAFEVVTDEVERSKLLSPMELKTLKLTDKEQKDIAELLEKRLQAMKDRDDLLKLEEELNIQGKDLDEAQKAQLSKARGRINEQSRLLGEQSAKRYVEQNFPGAQLEYGGAGSQSGDFDLVYRIKGGAGEGKDVFLVVEAKGGSGTLSTRNVGGVVTEQGTPRYLDDIAKNMASKGEAVGGDLLAARLDGRVRYVKIQAPVAAEGASVKFGEFDIRPKLP